ncbi:MAG: fumarylacetoacetate hydrolase family protein [Actinomycetia bacterium]|nr:fumarylacetoacetate hydrolase family protein [Actinomycetes bacterium]
MKFANITWEGRPAVAVARPDGTLAVLPETVAGMTVRATDDVIAAWDLLRRPIADALDGSLPTVAADRATFAPAVRRPPKIFCIGLNYRKHAEETGSPIPEYPVVFSKYHNTLAAHRETVPLPEESRQVDYEAELAIVMGRPARRVSEADALGYVFGYTPANDVSARDLQFRSGQWLLGKSCDKFAPVGPFVVTADEVGNPNALEIQLRLNGEVRQASNTADMIFSCAQIIAYLSKFWTLEPGDLILTGTPSGVIQGFPPDRRVWLKPGDVAVVSIEKLGELETRFQ